MIWGIVRVTYFILIGWWLALSWLGLCLFLSLFVVTWPLVFKMAEWTPAIAFLPSE